MVEYEYSFKVKDINPYITYCNNNGYQKVEESSQVRTLYKNENKILARITTKEINGVSKTSLDFKDEDDSEQILKVAIESIPLEIDSENSEAIMSILTILGYVKHKRLVRNRILYQKETVLFEIDDYIAPDKMQVIAIEGEKNAVDHVYLDIVSKLGENAIISHQ